MKSTKPVFQLAVVLMSLILQVCGNTMLAQQNINVEAADWPLKMWDKAWTIAVPAPPLVTSAKQELKLIKEKMTSLSEKDKAAVYYWNAGAPAYRWNQLAMQLLGKNPELMLRMPGSWINLAIYDATILAWKAKLKYKRPRPASADPALRTMIAAPATYSYPCEHTVTAAAAAYMLAYFLPAKADSILQLAREAADSRVRAGVQYPSDVEAGWELGKQVAARMIEKATNDGSANKWDGQMNKDPKKWTGAYPLGITLRSYVPILLASADQFRPAAPPDFTADMQELRSFKRNFTSNARAYFWASTGPEFWTDVTSKKIFEYNLAGNAPAAARIYTVLQCAAHDAAISVMDAKYAYWGIRPNQLDTTYKSLITTPPFPGYPSGHANGAAVNAAVLSYFFPADTREFENIAKECAQSRFDAGIHFRTDNEVGLQMGKQLGDWFARTWISGK